MQFEEMALSMFLRKNRESIVLCRTNWWEVADATLLKNGNERYEYTGMLLRKNRNCIWLQK